MKDLESTREDFEKFITRKAKEHEYQCMPHLLKRLEDGSYCTTWVDSAWMGWVAAVELYT